MSGSIGRVWASRRPWDVAARYAAEGFVVLAMDIFSRMERDVDLDYGDEGHAKGRALHKAFDYAVGVRDMQAGISFLRARPECTGKVGVVGFCLGGTMAYLAASRTDAVSGRKSGSCPASIAAWRATRRSSRRAIRRPATRVRARR